LLILVGPLLWHASPEKQNLSEALQPPNFHGGGPKHLLGTDEFGRDALARLIEGGRVSLAVSAISVIGAALLGIPAGLLAGYFGGVLDAIIMRIVDVQLAFPPFLLALTLISGLKPGYLPLVIILVLSNWVQYARFVRGLALSQRESQYVEASRTLGAGPFRVMARDLLPNIRGVALVVSTFAFSEAIILLAALSFLGVGVQPPTASWGGMIADGLPYLTNAWWLSVAPGVVLMLTILAANLLADTARDWLSLRGRSGGRTGGRSEQ
jgi:peptide/nickel transport system permease protein